MTKPPRLPQLNVNITVSQQEALNLHLPHGTKHAVVSQLLNLLIDLLEKPDSSLYLGLLMRGDFTLEQLLRINADPRFNSV